MKMPKLNPRRSTVPWLRSEPSGAIAVVEDMIKIREKFRDEVRKLGVANVDQTGIEIKQGFAGVKGQELTENHAWPMRLVINKNQ